MWAPITVLEAHEHRFAILVPFTVDADLGVIRERDQIVAHEEMAILDLHGLDLLLAFLPAFLVVDELAHLRSVGKGLS